MPNRSPNPYTPTSIPEEWPEDAWDRGYEQALEDVKAFFTRNHEKYTARQIEVHFAPGR